MKTVKESLRGTLTKDKIDLIPSSFDVVGDILIFADFPAALKTKEKPIAEAFLAVYKNIKVICKKTGKYAGTFRTPKLKILAGERRKETVHKENACFMKLNVETCYFSPRLATERLRVARLVKSGEHVLVMFSGVGPYPLVIARNSKAGKIVGIEKNPKAHAYAEENIRLNKVTNVMVHNADVRQLVPKLRQRFDRVLMPLPKGAGTFLELAIPRLKKGGVLHFYDFLPEGEFSAAEDKVQQACRKFRRKCSILQTVKCGQYAPRVFRVCVDAQIR